MRLFYSPTSPYVRKVMATAIAVGVDKLISLVPCNPHTSPAELLSQNPLSKVPCLVTDDGLSLFDSPVICEYLDAIGTCLLFPAGAPRWKALKNQAVGDGIMDAAIQYRTEQARPAEDARHTGMTRHMLAVDRALDLLESDPPADHLDIGTISVACALGYLDLRFAHKMWRDTHPNLATWYAKMAERPELKTTEPKP